VLEFEFGGLPVAPPPPAPAPFTPIPLGKPVKSELECDLGRVVEDAILGKVDTPFLVVLVGVPDARFLLDKGKYTSSVPMKILTSF